MPRAAASRRHTRRRCPSEASLSTLLGSTPPCGNRRSSVNQQQKLRIATWIQTLNALDPVFTVSSHVAGLLSGATRSHIDAFKRVRDARIDRYVVETNKLLIRLDKLLSPDAPTDPSKRKGGRHRQRKGRDVSPTEKDCILVLAALYMIEISV